MFMNTEGDAIRAIISGFEGPGGINSTDWHLAAFAAAWYIFTITTYGVWVPAGLFLPGIIIGCAVGGCYAEFQLWFMDNTIEKAFDSQTSVTFVLVGAGAMLSAYCRLTYSLVVIMLETTSSINIFLPMAIGILVARAVGNLFSGSLYDRALRMKQMPFLRSSAPYATKFLKASQVMAKDPISVPTIANMESCKKALQSHHNAFPVINTAGRLVGNIPKSMLVKILEEKSFYDKERTDSSVAGEATTDAFAVNENNEPLLNNGSVLGGNSDEFDLEYDEKNGFPITPESQILDWTKFTIDVMSTEADGEQVILDVIEENYDEWIDLRPYMIESPMAVSMHDKFYKVLE